MSASDYRARARQMLSGKWGRGIDIKSLLLGALGGKVMSDNNE